MLPRGELILKPALTEVEDKMLALSGNSHGSCGPHSLPLQRNNISELAATLVLSKFSYHKFSLSS
jgi:hypothetical protein